MSRNLHDRQKATGKAVGLEAARAQTVGVTDIRLSVGLMLLVSMIAVLAALPARAADVEHYRSPSWADTMTPPLSAMVRAGDRLILSGQLGFVPGQGLAEGVTAQVDAIFDSIEMLLALEGADLSHVTKCTCYLADMDTFGEFNRAYAPYFPEDPPARTTIGVAALPLGAAVEITCEAVRPHHSETE